MTYNIEQGTLLEAIRTAIGASTTANGTTYTWAAKPEGPVLRWLKEPVNYPLITLEVGDTAVEPGASLDEHAMGVTISAVIRPDTSPPAAIYQVIRELGQQLINDIMSAAARVGNWRDLIAYGVDTDTMDAEDVFDQGLGVYRIDLAVGFVVEDRNP